MTGKSTLKLEHQLSLDRLVSDFHLVVRSLLTSSLHSPLFLMGHSLGGAIAVNVANSREFCLEFNVKGVIVIDVCGELGSLIISTSFKVREANQKWKVLCLEYQTTLTHSKLPLLGGFFSLTYLHKWGYYFISLTLTLGQTTELRQDQRAEVSRKKIARQ